MAITSTVINDNAQALYAFAGMDEVTIRDYWIRAEEPRLDAFDNIEYQYDTRSPSAFIMALDPVNRRNYLFKYFYGNDIAETIIGFFAWIRNMLSIIDIEELVGDASDLVKLWSRNEILFYFQLPDDLREVLIHRYNRELNRVVSVLNKM